MIQDKNRLYQLYLLKTSFLIVFYMANCWAANVSLAVVVSESVLIFSLFKNSFLKMSHFYFLTSLKILM